MLSQLLMVFGFFSLVLILIYWINRAVILFDQLISDGQNIVVFLEMTLLSLPPIIKLVLPLAGFAASLYVTHRMTTDSELTVVQATGFSPWRLARPVLVFGLFVTVMMSALAHVLTPLSITQSNARQAEIAQDATARILRDGQFITPTPGVTVFIREITPAGELRDIFLSDTRDPSEGVTYTATSAFLVRTPAGPQLVMRDGMIQTLRTGTGRLITTSFQDLAYDISTLIGLPDTSRRSARELKTWELLSPTPDLIAQTQRDAARLRTEAHERIAETLLATVAALLGFATLLVGGFSRFGVWKQVVAAILLVILVKGVESVITAPVREDPRFWPLVYLPSLLGLVIVWGLLFWAARPGLFRRRPTLAAAPAPHAGLGAT
ncbi:MAG: LPS export ABC transporter permease LptF [Rubellimicrobium sp.]|nr:LPS export ABC transporter permease LptF [Rubellimicrobium sp.]